MASMIQDQNPSTPETLILFIAGNLIWLLSIPIISDIFPWASLLIIYFRNKKQVDEAMQKTWNSIKSVFNAKVD